MGVKVDFHRPKRLCTGRSKLSDVISFTLNKFYNKGENFDYFCMLWPTSPLREINDIKKSFTILERKKEMQLLRPIRFAIFFCTKDW